MPRYYFHVNNGTDSPDHEGTELRSLSVARAEALMLAGGIISDAGARADPGEERRVTVTDDAGLILFHLNVQVTMASAAVAA